MDNIKDDFYYVKRLLKSIEVTSRYLEGIRKYGVIAIEIKTY